ncbi:dynamin family protein [Caldimonas tepidiphila]|uniref:dynamin family protein n=1 Tax=Caldimonas tepidiphila TaxID=2315841 RepID=UPI000E5B32B3|nr:dynamin family protein [Caldimonas tepidiphila]
MVQSFANKLDSLGLWRSRLDSTLQELSRFLLNHDLLDATAGELLESLRLRVGNDKLVVAFVAEFSRGKSELINAIFFADTGRRILPATPGRTTMCPVELSYDPEEPPALMLLDIETRLQQQSLAELRTHRPAWKQLPLDVRDPAQLVDALQRVMDTRVVPLETARALGLWDDEHPEDNPPLLAEDRVEVPAWRHAVINYPHPLLRRGLVVLDTPGLNAIGAEPELTLGLLPSAHAVVFILAADTGVTKSDMAIWREHLGGDALARFVALNKIDALSDPLSGRAEIEIQIARQRAQTAQSLGVPETRVFPLSARDALAARIDGDTHALAASRILELEETLASELLPRRQDMLHRLVLEGIGQIESQIGRDLADRRRQLAEQLIELRSLRGKNSGIVGLMLKRVESESAEFEQCIGRVLAMRAVHARMLKDVLQGLGPDVVREHVERLQQQLRASLLKLGGKKAFGEMCARLRERLKDAQLKGGEIHDMLGASFAQLNTEFGFGLAVPPAPDLQQFVAELDLIERNYVQYLGITQALRLSQPRFLEQFRRMLVSKIRAVFEGANAELDQWNKTVSAQIDSQLRERRRNFKRRRETLERVQQASAELETRIAEVESQEERLRQLQQRLAVLLQRLRHQAGSAPGSAGPEAAPEPEAAEPA